MIIKPKSAIIFLLTVLLLISCSVPSTISVRVQKPAAIHLPAVKEIAIVDFHGHDRSGSQIATLVQSKLMKTEHYDILERDKLRRVLEEQNLGLAGIVDEATAVEVGRLLGVDALIFGEVTTYELERDERGVEKVSRKVGTGKYEWVDQKNIFTGKTKKVKREIMKTVLVDQHYRIRRGTVAINFRVVGVKTGQLLAAHSDSKSYNSGKVVEGGRKTIPAAGEILADLSNEICDKFVRLIAPYFVREERKIESGKDQIKVGIKYAESGLWPEALKAWKQATVEMPTESAAFYNLGLAYEIQGMLDEAESSYKKAVDMKQKKLYLEAMARIRRARQEHEKLMKQLHEREEETDW